MQLPVGPAQGAYRVRNGTYGLCVWLDLLALCMHLPQCREWYYSWAWGLSHSCSPISIPETLLAPSQGLRNSIFYFISREGNRDWRLRREFCSEGHLPWPVGSACPQCWAVASVGCPDRGFCHSAQPEKKHCRPGKGVHSSHSGQGCEQTFLSLSFPCVKEIFGCEAFLLSEGHFERTIIKGKTEFRTAPSFPCSPTSPHTEQLSTPCSPTGHLYA